MRKSYIKINSGETTPEEIKELIVSQDQLAKLLELSEGARLRKKHPDQSYGDTFLAQVKKILS